MHWVGDVGVADDNDYADDNNHVIPIADAYCVHQKWCSKRKRYQFPDVEKTFVACRHLLVNLNGLHHDANLW